MTVTMIVTDQKISDTTPKIASCRRLDRMRVARVEDRLDRVERARPDVAEDDAERADRECGLSGGSLLHRGSILATAAGPGTLRRTPLGAGDTAAFPSCKTGAWHRLRSGNSRRGFGALER